MKLPQISGKDLINKLKKCGFVATRQVGSHVRLEKYADDKLIKLTIPVHVKPLKKGTLSRILKDAGIAVDDIK